MTYSELIQLIASDETRTLEMKKTTGELKDGMHSACAFLNTDGGWLIFGVAPTSLKVLGQQVTDNTRREIAQALSGLEPALDVYVHYVDVPDAKSGEQVIAMHFDGWTWGNNPYTYHGCPYYKIESTTKQMPREMFEERLRAAKPDYFAWESQPSLFKSVDSVDEKLLRGVIRLGVERGRLPESAMTESAMDILRKWKLADGDALLNGATALFTKEVGMYTQFTLRMARFRGTDKNEFIDNQRVEGNLFVLLNEAMSFCRKHLNMSGKIVGLVREEHLDVPAEALRETLLNALCHRLYERHNMTIGLAIYDDRIEIENPGVLPPQIDVTHIENAHYSSPHNPRIANVLYHTGYIENWGSGIQRIVSTCKKFEVSLPTWQQLLGDVVVVTFARHSELLTANDGHNDSQNDGQNDGQNGSYNDGQNGSLNGRQKKISILIHSDREITVSRIAKKFRVSPSTIYRDLKVIGAHWDGSARKGHWEFGK